MPGTMHRKAPHTKLGRVMTKQFSLYPLTSMAWGRARRDEAPPPSGVWVAGVGDAQFGAVGLVAAAALLVVAALLMLVRGRRRSKQGKLPREGGGRPPNSAAVQEPPAIPEGLLLGLTIAGLREAVESRPPGATEALEGQTVCERLRHAASVHVGPATVFVRCADPRLPLSTVVEALERLARGRPEWAAERFWVDALSGDAQTERASLGPLVRAIGRTVVVLERWPPDDDAMEALSRASCAGAIYHTSRRGGALHMVAADAERRAAFEAALLDDFGAVQMALSRVDVRRAERPGDGTADERDDGARAELAAEPGGLPRVNQRVVGALRASLAEQGCALLDTLGTQERGLSPLIVQLGRLLSSAGRAGAARALFEEAHATRSEALGWRHADTRLAFDNLVELLREQSDLAATRRLHEERLTACREQLGDAHPETLGAMTALGTLLKEVGNLGAALPLLEEALSGLRTAAGPKDAQTLEAVHRLAMLHFYARRLPRAKALLMEAIRGLGETRGGRHPDTLDAVANLGRLFQLEGHAAGALPLLTEALAGRRAALGEDHPETIDSMGQLGALQQMLGELDAARQLFSAGLAALKRLNASREQVPPCHPPPPPPPPPPRRSLLPAHPPHARSRLARSLLARRSSASRATCSRCSSWWATTPPPLNSAASTIWRLLHRRRASQRRRVASAHEGRCGFPSLAARSSGLARRSSSCRSPTRFAPYEFCEGGPGRVDTPRIRLLR